MYYTVYTLHTANKRRKKTTTTLYARRSACCLSNEIHYQTNRMDACTPPPPPPPAIHNNNDKKLTLFNQYRVYCMAEKLFYDFGTGVYKTHLYIHPNTRTNKQRIGRFILPFILFAYIYLLLCRVFFWLCTARCRLFSVIFRLPRFRFFCLTLLLHKIITFIYFRLSRIKKMTLHRVFGWGFSQSVRFGCNSLTDKFSITGNKVCMSVFVISHMKYARKKCRRWKPNHYALHALLNLYMRCRIENFIKHIQRAWGMRTMVQMTIICQLESFLLRFSFVCGLNFARAAFNTTEYTYVRYINKCNQLPTDFVDTV